MKRAVTFICERKCYPSASAAAGNRRRALCGFADFEWSRASRTATSGVENEGRGESPSSFSGKQNEQFRFAPCCALSPSPRGRGRIAGAQRKQFGGGGGRTNSTPPPILTRCRVFELPPPARGGGRHAC